jgi:hypothetical protein
MKFFYHGKDGGPDSTVHGYWLCEIRSLFSIALLCFEHGSREAYHSHAFNSVSWVLKGSLFESELGEVEGVGEIYGCNVHLPSIRPIMTYRYTFHKVSSHGRTWVLTFRGPWKKNWREYLPKEKKFIKLEIGRKLVSED